MENKTLNLLTLADDEKGIQAIIDKVIKDNPIDIYTDYRDFEYLPEMVGKYNTREEFENDIIKSYDEWIFDEQRATVSLVEDELHKVYQFDELSDSLYEHIRNCIYDQQVINYPFNDFLKQEIKVNILITLGGSDDAETEELDYRTLQKFLEKLGYTQTKTILNEMVKGEYKDTGDKFLNSLYEEIYNAYKEQFNYLTFIGTLRVDQYYELLENPRSCTIGFDSQTYCGFFDPHNGGGSLLGINLPKVVTFRGDTIKMLLVEGGPKRYTVDEVYGLTSKCYQPIGFVKGMPKHIKGAK